MKKLIMVVVVILIVIGGIIGVEEVALKEEKVENFATVAYLYKGNSDADGIEIDEEIELNKAGTTLENLNKIRNKLIEKTFNGIDIETLEIDKNNVLTVDLKDADKRVTEYLDAGSAGGKIYLDVLTADLLQPESDLKDWIDGLKILLNGEENAEGSHFNLQGIFERKLRSKTLTYIKDYGYDKTPVEYDKKFIVNAGAQQFVLEPVNGTEIIINEIKYVDDNIAIGEEVFRTNEKLLLVMELPEGGPNIRVKLMNNDRSSTWFPFFNGKDGSLIVPEEFEIKDIYRE